MIGSICFGIDTTQKNCINYEDFGLANFRIHYSRSKVENLIKKRTSLKTTTSEDDGGLYEIKTYFLKGLEIDIVRNKVNRIRSYSKTYCTPSGICPNQDISIVASKLVNLDITKFKKNGKIKLFNCYYFDDPNSGLNEDYTILSFKNGILEYIEVNAIHP